MNVPRLTVCNGRPGHSNSSGRKCDRYTEQYPLYTISISPVTVYSQATGWAGSFALGSSYISLPWLCGQVRGGVGLAICISFSLFPSRFLYFSFTFLLRFTSSLFTFITSCPSVSSLLIHLSSFAVRTDQSVLALSPLIFLYYFILRS